MSNTLRALRASIWAGWYRDFGWVNPAAGLFLRVIPPTASVLALVLIYGTAAVNLGIPLQADHFAFLIIGGALYAHIAAYSWVSSLAIAEGKWTYVFQSVYISPKSATPYLAGRTLASFLSSATTSVVALVVGYYVTIAIFPSAGPIPFNITIFSIPLFMLALLVNILASMGLGFLLSAYSIYSTKFEWALPTYISGLLMIFSGALFPVTVLPHPIQDFANFLPFTNFIRASREALLGPPAYGSISAYTSDLGLCLLGGLVFLALGLETFKLAENRARRLGILDRKAV